MTDSELRASLLALPDAEEDFPFGPETAVYRVGGKMFALVPSNEAPLRVNLKCDPDRSLSLRDTWQAVTPGYHMSKRHWNTIEIGLDLPDDAVYELIQHSYALVRNSLPKSALLRSLR